MRAPQPLGATEFALRSKTIDLNGGEPRGDVEPPRAAARVNHDGEESLGLSA
jgi:hypothetical protein